MPTIYSFFDLADEISSIGEKLIPNWFAFLVQLISLVLLLVIIFIFADFIPSHSAVRVTCEGVRPERRIARHDPLKSAC